MATTRIRESYKIGKNQRVVRYYKPSEYVVVNIINWCITYLFVLPITYLFKGLWWIIKTPIKLLVDLVKRKVKEHN